MFPVELRDRLPAARTIFNAALTADPKTITTAMKRKSEALLLLRTLCESDEKLTHKLLDEANASEAASRTARSFLIAIGILEYQDPLFARLEHWVQKVSGDITFPDHKLVFEQFASWKHLRELRRRDSNYPLSYGTFKSRQRALLMVAYFLNALSTRGLTLATADQAFVDAWLFEGAQERRRINAFLIWAERAALCGHLEARQNRRSKLPKTAENRVGRLELVRALLDAPLDSDTSTRLAGLLVLLFGIRTNVLVSLRVDDLVAGNDKAQILLGKDPLELPSVFVDLVMAARENRTTRRMFVTMEESEWLFPGARAGVHMSVSTLRARLRAIGVKPSVERSAALTSLIQQVPPIVLSRTIGISVQAALRWADAVSANYAHYVPVGGRNAE